MFTVAEVRAVASGVLVCHVIIISVDLVYGMCRNQIAFPLPGMCTVTWYILLCSATT